VYFDGVVNVGDFYRLDDGGERFEADQFITVSTADQSAVLQEVQYHSSCSQNLELKNRFGASQLVAYFNAVQGNVTCFNVLEFSLNIDVPIEVSGQTVTLTSLVAMTNFAGTIDLTNQVTGQTVGAGGNIVVTLSGTIDTTTRREYTMMFTIEGVRGDGVPCFGVSTLTFEAGNVPGAALPPSLPVPTSAGGGSMGSTGGGTPTGGGTTGGTTPTGGGSTGGTTPTGGGSTGGTTPTPGTPTGGGTTIVVPTSGGGSTGSMGTSSGGSTGSMGTSSGGSTGSMGTTSSGTSTSTSSSMSSGGTSTGSMSSMTTAGSGEGRKRRRLFAW
jgi:hypothetical protein